ncbi:hypothetical protein [Candidatus Uabimicrobium sp. HlEnr_7]|uniref:hypothetical protein n=1 Tax=Candidatus Uabimicrobium helgolandensis TaxID=3095367 RepID=UPI0035576361
MDFIESLKDSAVTKVSFTGSGFAASYLAHSKAKDTLNNLEKNSWIGYVMPSGAKKWFAIGAAIISTGTASIAASFLSPENKKYVWIGGVLSLILILSQEAVGISKGSGSSDEGVDKGSGDGNSILPTEKEIINTINLPKSKTIQDLKKVGFIDAVIENNNTLKVTVGDDIIYSPIGSVYITDSSTMEIFLEEVKFVISNFQEVKTVEIFRNFGNQQIISSRIDQIVNHAEENNKIIILREKPFTTWGSIHS